MTSAAYRFRFSVVTPTYNRAHLLTHVFNSLEAQTFRNFEWIIVDDGSTDDTQDVIRTWDSSFPVRYIWKPNGGMHTALNVATRNASGEFITQLDSDDRCVPNALERFDWCWRQISDPTNFAAAIALCCRPDGTILGSRLPKPIVDTSCLSDALALNDADRWGMMRADICREFPFPEIPGEKFIMPGIAYNRMLKKYSARYFDEPLKIAYYVPGHMSSFDHRRANPRGAFLYHTELALSAVPLPMRVKSALNAIRFAPRAFFKKRLRRNSLP